ncbi:MAG TPA: GAF domain-containing protein [Anaerolineales bacterium]|nr:GAF domain-containing protein [Anaerolineales bacterium]
MAKLKKDEGLELAQLREQLHHCNVELQAQQASFERAQKVQSALYRIAEAASAATDMQEFYSAVHRIVGELMYAENFIIALYDEQSDLITWPYYVDTVDVVPPAPTRRKDHRGATGWVLRHGKTIADADGSWAAAKLRGEAQLVGSESEGIAVPLRVEDKTHGVILVQSYIQGIGYQLEDVKVLEFVARHIAAALTRARAIEETRQRNAELAIINSVQAGLVAQMDMQAIYDLVGDKIRDVFDAQTVLILRRDDQFNYFPYLIERGKRLQQEPLPVIDHKGFGPYVMRTGQPLLINDEMEARSLEFGSSTVGGGEMPKSAIFVPLIVSNTAQGVISIQNVDHKNAFTESDLHLLTTIANSLSIALENARLFEETQRLLKETEQRAAELAIINSIQTALAVKLDFQGIVDTVGSKLTEIFSEENAGIGFLDKPSNLYKVPYAFENGKRIEYFEFPLGDRGLVSHIFRIRQPLVINKNYDQRAEELGAIDISGEPDPKSWLGVPIMINDEVIGAFTLQNWERENAYSDADVRLLQTLAGSIGVALENARLFEAIQTRNREIGEALERERATGQILGVIASSRTEIQPVLDAIAENAARLSGSDDAIITYVEGEFLRLMSHYGSIPILEVGECLPLDRETVVGRAVLERRALQTIHEPGLADSEYPAGDATANRFGYQMTFAAPLLRHGAAIGAITIRHVEPKLLTERQIGLVRTFADQAVIAIENVRLFEETQRLLKDTQQRNAELAIINSVQEGLASKLDYEAIIDLVGEQIGKIFEADVVQINLYNRAENRISIPYCVERGERHQHDSREPWGFRKYVIENRQSLIINEDLEEAGKKFENPTIAGESPRSIAFIPLIAGDQVLGIVSLQNMERENAFPESTVRLLETLANSMSIALDNARLFEETQQRAAELSESNKVQAALYQIAETATAAEDMAAFYRRIHDIVREMMSAENFIIQLYDDAKQRVSYPYVVDTSGELKPLPPVPIAKIRKGLAMYSLQSNQTLHVSRSQVDEMVARGEIESIGPSAEDWVSVPLQTGGKTIGVIAVQQYEPGGVYTEKDVRLLEFVAQHIATALERARSIQETQRLLAETEQRAAELAIINSVQTALAVKLDFQGIIDSVGNKLAEIFSEENVGIGFLDKATNIFKVPYLIENGRRIENFEFPLGERGLVSHMLKTRQPLVINTDFDQRAGELGVIDVSGEPDPKSWLGVPIIIHDEVIGGFSLQNWEREHAYADSEVRLLQTLAGSLGVALENARLFAEVQKRNQEISEALEQQTATSEVLRVLSSFQPDLRSLLEIIAVNAAKVCGADDAHIYRIEGEALKEWTHRGPIPGLEAGESLPLNRSSVIGRAIVDR